MIHHLASFRWADGVTEEHVERVGEALRAMAAQVDGLRSFHCGPNAGIGLATNYDFGVLATFDDAAGWSNYDTHPAHAQVRSELLAPWITDRVVIQFES